MIANYIGAVAAMIISVFTFPEMMIAFLIYSGLNVLAAIINGIGASIK